MSLTSIKQKLGFAVNPMANDFRLRPNHRCYPPSYPHLPGGGEAGGTAATALTPIAASRLFDYEPTYKLATPIDPGTGVMVFLNGILLEPEDYDLQGECIKIYPADPQDSVHIFVAAGDQASGGTVPQPDPYLDQPVPLDELRYTLAPGGSPYMSTNKDTAIIGTYGAMVNIAEAGQRDGYCYTRFQGTLVALNGSVFQRYKSIITMRLPDSVERLGNSCFEECAIQRLDAGSGLRSLGYSVFKNAGNLRELVIRSRWCPEIPNANVLAGVHPDFHVLVPSETIEMYHSDNVWNLFDIRPLD